MKTIYIFWSYLAHFFLGLEMFQTAVVVKIKPHILWISHYQQMHYLYVIYFKSLF